MVTGVGSIDSMILPQVHLGHSDQQLTAAGSLGSGLVRPFIPGPALTGAGLYLKAGRCFMHNGSNPTAT